jgi:thiol-disulfide isomerase/thioredoxin
LNVAAVLLVVLAIFSNTGTAEEVLSIGSTAPSLEIEHWVHDGEGAFKPVKDFEKDKVYVVEFWATWCGPCREVMPHLAEMQTKYGTKIQFISVSDEPLETVQEFLKTKANDEKTFDEVTKAYCLTTDPDGSVGKSYMEAAAQNGIPCAFVVGKDSKIEWIGHPMTMAAILDQVLEGKWDRDTFAKVFNEQQKSQRMLMEIVSLARKGDKESLEAAIKKIDEVLAAPEKSPAASQLVGFKLMLLVQAEAENAVLVACIEDILKSSDDPQALLQVGYSVSGMQLEKKLDAPELCKNFAAKLEGAIENADAQMKSAIQYVTGRLYVVGGEKEKGLKLLEDAKAGAPEGLVKEIDSFLEATK